MGYRTPLFSNRSVFGHAASVYLVAIIFWSFLRACVVEDLGVVV